MTEKQYAPTAKEKKMAKPKKTDIPAEAPVKKIEEKKINEEVSEVKEEVKTEETKDEKKEVKKQPVKKIKRDVAVVNANNVKVSTRYSIEICRFIKSKRIGDAIRDLEEVIAKKKHVPMRGEYGHKHGVGKVASGAGKYPLNASKVFIVLLKSLLGNANAGDMEEPYIAEAIANNAPKPAGRFGRWARKRTHIKLVAREMKVSENKKSKRTKKVEEKK